MARHSGLAQNSMWARFTPKCWAAGSAAVKHNRATPRESLDIRRNRGCDRIGSAPDQSFSCCRCCGWEQVPRPASRFGAEISARTVGDVEPPIPAFGTDSPRQAGRVETFLRPLDLPIGDRRSSSPDRTVRYGVAKPRSKKGQPSGGRSGEGESGGPPGKKQRRKQRRNNRRRGSGSG
jgi:hypothetical protein